MRIPYVREWEGQIEEKEALLFTRDCAKRAKKNFSL